jgi:hypothetical protein
MTQRCALLSGAFRHPQVCQESPISDALGLSLEELLGKVARASKRGPAPRLQEQIERIGTLPRSKQRMLIDMLEAAINSADARAA